MARNRDEFSPAIKENLAKRAAQRCSNPDCGDPTSGPHQDEDKAINVGVCAHITAAAPGGPRYNQFLTPEERAAISNAIWLCQKCAKLIDSDVKAYTEELIRLWKRRHEAAIKANIQGTAEVGNSSRSPAQLNIDAIFSTPSADNKACVLDIRVSNPGGSDLMINAIQFKVIESLELGLLGHATYSAQYDLDIGKMRAFGSVAECGVAQILKPGEADRFAIILSDSHARSSVGGWRLATLFRTNVGEVQGPETEVWLPRPEVIRTFDEVTSFWLRKAEVQSFLVGRPFQKLGVRPTDPTSPEGIEYSKFVETGGGALAYPSTTGGFETYVVFGLTLGLYRGPHPLWERATAEMEPRALDVEVAKFFYSMFGTDAPEKVALKLTELAEQGNAKMADDWRRVFEQVKLLIPKG